VAEPDDPPPEDGSKPADSPEDAPEQDASGERAREPIIFNQRTGTEAAAPAEQSWEVPEGGEDEAASAKTAPEPVQPDAEPEILVNEPEEPPPAEASAAEPEPVHPAAPEPEHEPEPLTTAFTAAPEADPQPDPPEPDSIAAAPEQPPANEPAAVAAAAEPVREEPVAEPPPVTIKAVQPEAAPDIEPEPAPPAVEAGAPEAEPEPEPEPEPQPAIEPEHERVLFNEPEELEAASADEALFDTGAAPSAEQPAPPETVRWDVSSAKEPDAVEEVEVEIVRAPVSFVDTQPAPEPEPEPMAASAEPEPPPKAETPELAAARDLSLDDEPAQPSFAARLDAGRAAIIAAVAAPIAKLRATLDDVRRPRPPADESEAAGSPSLFRDFHIPRLIPQSAPSWRTVAIAAASGFAAFVVLIAGFFIYVTWGMPSTKDLWAARDVPSLTFVDRHGRVIIREGAQNAPPTDLSKLPEYVPEAVIAIEDRRFYEHWGVDISGLMRAAASNMKAGRVVQGGSTLTQQLAKNLFLTNERSFRRKAQEVALAFWLESQFTKDEILALYLSRVYFGAGAWGIEAASERYFDKPARDLTLAEAALLAGLLKAPSRLNPASRDTAAKARAKIVLDEMLTAGFITEKEHAAALKAPLSISRVSPNGNLGYFRDWVDAQLNQIIGDQRDDFIIHTTLDLEAQRAGERAVDNTLATQGELMNVHQGALIAMDADGGVRAMVGGRSYGKAEGQSEFNRTTQSRRQPGSSFKFFIYLTAMATGNYSPATVRVDEPITIGDWSPGNYEDKYSGPVTLTTAYAKSLNMIAILLAHEVGGDNVIATAEKLGVKTKLYNYRSLALGAQGLPLIEMTTAYGAMANNGVPIEPHGIASVQRANGQVVWAFRKKRTEPAIDERARRMMNFLGSRVVRAGTGTRAQLPNREVAGKTGTGNDYRDAWFIGYVPGLVAGVWVGNDNFSETKRVTGGVIPAQIWKEFMTVAVRDTPYKPLDMPRAEDYPEPAAAVVGDAAAAVETVTRPPVKAVGDPFAPARNPASDGGDG
jgi:penicillin-binding protein 1A